MKTGYLCLIALLAGGCTALPQEPKPEPVSPGMAMPPPSQAELYLGVVDGLIRQKRYEAAIAFLAKYQKSQVLTPRYHKLAGDALAGAGRIDEAIAAYRQILKTALAPEAYNGIGKALSARGAWSEAAENFRQAATLDPSNASYLNNFGYAQLEQDFRGPDLAPVVSELRRAHELDPGSNRIRDNLALALSLSGSEAQFRAFLNTIADPAHRKQVADFSATWKPGKAAAAGTEESAP
jgi:Flp pilus assembly protein TadD